MENSGNPGEIPKEPWYMIPQPLLQRILDHASGRRRTTPATLLYSLLVNGKFRKPWWDTQEDWFMLPRTVSKIWSKYSKQWNCLASFPISTFLYLWMIYIFPRSVRLCCCIAFANQLWEYINHYSRNLERDRTDSFWGIRSRWKI